MNRFDAEERIMIALDCPDADSAWRLVRRLDGFRGYWKVGMELFYAAGPQFVRELKQNGQRIFLDLKLHDIPNTVKGAAASITRLGADMFNVHAAGGDVMMRAALEGVDEAQRSDPSLARPTVIAVTQLTSTNQRTLNEEIGIPGPLAAAVARYARMARAAGLDGVVASAHEVETIKDNCGREFLTVVPGIRPPGAPAGDQSRIMTPRQAIERGADYLVIGRPITAAAEPKRALESILEELR